MENPIVKNQCKICQWEHHKCNVCNHYNKVLPEENIPLYKDCPKFQSCAFCDNLCIREFRDDGLPVRAIIWCEGRRREFRNEDVYEPCQKFTKLREDNEEDREIIYHNLSLLEYHYLPLLEIEE